MEFKDVLKSLRKESNVSQFELSKKIGVSLSSISMYEIGKRTPELETFEKIADYFNVDMDYLKGKSDIRNAFLRSGNFLVQSPNAYCKIIPIVGKVSAGLPAETEENVEGFEGVDDYRIDYALKVIGDSMIGARIFNGDIVYVCKDCDYYNGDIVIACVNEFDATIKRYYRYGNTIILKPENPSLKEQEYNAKDITLKGKVISAKIIF